MEDRCVKCPASPDDGGFLHVESTAGGLRSESSGGAFRRGRSSRFLPKPVRSS